MLTALFQSVLTLFLLHPPPGDGDDRQGPPPPPPEAIDACVDAVEGDACSFEGRAGETVGGECWRPTSEVPLACRPDQPPPPR